MRTKGQIRGSKSKGRQFERDCEASLQQIFSDCHLTHEKGYIQEYDLQSHNHRIAVECKRLKGVSWNECKKYWTKLASRAPPSYEPLLLFKSNHQPCLVMYQRDGVFRVEEFESLFSTKFIKHEPIKVRKEVVPCPLTNTK